jgi:hypothetical protein
MYIAETTNGSHSLTCHPSVDGNLVELSVFEGRLGGTGEPVDVFKFSVREATDLRNAIDEGIRQTLEHADK